MDIISIVMRDESVFALFVEMGLMSSGFMQAESIKPKDLEDIYIHI